jgi:integrase
VLTGIRRHELHALRWGDVDLLEGVLRVRDSKTEESIHSIALSPAFGDELAEHYRRTAFKARLSSSSATRNAARATQRRPGPSGSKPLARLRGSPTTSGPFTIYGTRR